MSEHEERLMAVEQPFDWLAMPSKQRLRQLVNDPVVVETSLEEAAHILLWMREELGRW